MGSHGIRDQVAIVGMGCTPFAEHFDKGIDDLEDTVKTKIYEKQTRPKIYDATPSSSTSEGPKEGSTPGGVHGPASPEGGKFPPGTTPPRTSPPGMTFLFPTGANRPSHPFSRRAKTPPPETNQ